MTTVAWPALAAYRAEQVWLLARLAADTGARRGELAALKIGDLPGRVLHIARAASMEQMGPTNTRRSPASLSEGPPQQCGTT